LLIALAALPHQHEKLPINSLAALERLAKVLGVPVTRLLE
jgi:hypothetical protein